MVSFYKMGNTEDLTQQNQVLSFYCKEQGMKAVRTIIEYGKLNEEYADLLTRDKYPSFNFWNVKKELIKIKNILECVLICEDPR